MGDEPFAVMLPDELMGSSALLAQMNGVCASTGGSVVAVVNVPREQVSSYGVIDPAGELSADGVIPVRDLVEKPSIEDAPSNFVITGRYVLTARRLAGDRRPATRAWRRAAVDGRAARPGGAITVPRRGVVARAATTPATPLGFLTSSIELALHAPRVRGTPQGVPRRPPTAEQRSSGDGSGMNVDRLIGSVAAEAVGEVGDEAELVDVEVDGHARLVDVLPTAVTTSGT